MGKHADSYKPELAGTLQEIFDLAWQELNSASDYPLTGENANARRNNLAQMIILAHKSGMQPEEIKEAILGDIASAFCRRNRSYGSLLQTTDDG